MSGSWNDQDLPNLDNSNHRITSPVTSRYNCIAWAAEDDHLWWWPDPLNTCYWPPNVSRETTLEAFIQAYSQLGYEVCDDGNLEDQFEKITIYTTRKFGIKEPTHAARQLPNGKWTSKLGPQEDIEHSAPESVNGPVYGSPEVYMRRPLDLNEKVHNSED